VVCRWELGSGSRLGQDSNATEGQGIMGDVTFHNLDRDVARAAIRHGEDRDARAWQDEDEDREARNQR
jgi:hypothetical protein